VKANIAIIGAKLKREAEFFDFGFIYLSELYHIVYLLGKINSKKMSIKNFLMRKMLSNQLKGVPQAEQDKIFSMIEKNPDFFQKVAVEVQEEMKKGKSQMDATMEVVKRYETDLKGMM
jgi:hypothetical protein